MLPAQFTRWRCLRFLKPCQVLLRPAVSPAATKRITLSRTTLSALFLCPCASTVRCTLCFTRTLKRAALLSNLGSRCQLAVQLARALHDLREANLVHRDIKSGNIVLTGPPHKLQLALIDFGFAADAETAFDLSRDEQKHGTSRWKSPEQLSPSSATLITNATDVWSGCCVFIELLVGRQPWTTNPDYVKDSSQPIDRAWQVEDIKTACSVAQDAWRGPPELELLWLDDETLLQKVVGYPLTSEVARPVSLQLLHAMQLDGSVRSVAALAQVFDEELVFFTAVSDEYAPLL